MFTAERVRLMAEGRAAFNRGDFFVAHEHWETVWRACATSDRTWIQGLIQLAAGHHLVARGRRNAAARLIARGLVKLLDAPARLDGIDVTVARHDAELLLGDLERGCPPPLRRPI